MFQFLIGRLKTSMPYYLHVGIYGFQFLIGRLKTVIVNQLHGIVSYVSIPDR